MSREEKVVGLHAVGGLLDAAPSAIVELALDAGRDDRRFRELQERAERAGVVTIRLPRRELDRLAGGGRHQGAVARARVPEVRGERFLEELLTSLSEPPFLLILDQVQDPHNLGACMRSAEAAGVHAVVTPRDRACGLNVTVRKVASGAAETLPLVQVTNLARTLRMLRHAGVWLAGADARGQESVFDTDLRGPLGLVLGAEGKGLRRLTREQCDRLLHVPMRGSVASLNVSVAAGVMLFETLRQRDAPRESCP